MRELGDGNWYTRAGIALILLLAALKAADMLFTGGKNFGGGNRQDGYIDRASDY